MACSIDSFNHLWKVIEANLNKIKDVLSIIGLAYVGKVGLQVIAKSVKVVYLYGLARALGPRDLVSEYGRWAVVTGSTDGIGKEYARQLASLGMCIVLISRNLDKLNQVAAEIEKEFKVETCVIQADFSQGRDVYDKIKTVLEGKDLGILVNNAGVMLEYPMDISEYNGDRIWNHVNINIGGVTMMTRIVIPEMLRKKRGAIVNISSSSAIGPLPYMNIYSASKIYVDYFSQGLRAELYSKGIDVQTIIPFYIATKMTIFSDKLAKNFLVPNAQSFVRSALCTLGRSPRCTGYWTHEIQVWKFFFFTFNI
ncbi:hypothetical protein QYM36_016650 [Artemia franciscana]|uniref:Uncharacterized protein n=1 Tax=Artemia franciscana TaxID=6661 RepID=A0AA88KS99_ARTSF|nr:hypothetical protein QYM36_016650 [Artemia franciscana]